MSDRPTEGGDESSTNTSTSADVPGDQEPATDEAPAGTEIPPAVAQQPEPNQALEETLPGDDVADDGVAGDGVAGDGVDGDEADDQTGDEDQTTGVDEPAGGDEDLVDHPTTTDDRDGSQDPDLSDEEAANSAQGDDLVGDENQSAGDQVQADDQTGSEEQTTGVDQPAGGDEHLVDHPTTSDDRDGSQDPDVSDEEAVSPEQDDGALEAGDDEQADDDQPFDDDQPAGDDQPAVDEEEPVDGPTATDDLDTAQRADLPDEQVVSPEQDDDETAAGTLDDTEADPDPATSDDQLAADAETAEPSPADETTEPRQGDIPEDLAALSPEEARQRWDSRPDISDQLDWSDLDEPPDNMSMTDPEFERLGLQPRSTEPETAGVVDGPTPAPDAVLGANPDGRPTPDGLDLDSFSGEVQPFTMEPGVTYYRVVGDTSRPNGAYWTTRPPASEAELRGDLAVKNQFNGDHAVVAFTPSEPVQCWGGKVGPQEATGDVRRHLPGGGYQLWVPPNAISTGSGRWQIAALEFNERSRR